MGQYQERPGHACPRVYCLFIIRPNYQLIAVRHCCGRPESYRRCLSGARFMTHMTRTRSPRTRPKSAKAGGSPASAVQPKPSGSRSQRVTIVDVATRAGVSLGTVSRVINNKESVAPALRERVNEAARALGYVPNSVAQSMRTHSTQVVGCLVPDISNPLFSVPVGAAEEVLHRHGYSIMLSNGRNCSETESETLTLFQRRRFDGLIVTLSREDDPVTLRLLSECTIPVVLLERDSTLPLDAVSIDHYGGTLQAMNYLIKLGHRRIGLVTVTQAVLPGRQRRDAYIAAHQAAGLPVDETLMSPDVFLPDAGYQAAYRMLVSPNPPTAILAGANQIPQVLKVVHMLKLAIPRQLSLITLGDTDVASFFEPALTAVRWELAKVGTAAAELLLARLNTRNPERDIQRVTIPTELVLRESCIQR